MLRRWRRLQASQVHTSRPFSTPRAQVIRARAAASSSAGVAPHVAHTGRGSDAVEPGIRGATAVHAGQPSARTAALAAFLKSRTFCSDTGSTTSATERNEPGSA